MREFNLDRLRTLVCIADLGSFAAAARALNLAPPTVTLQVAQLEERLGARLLTRAPAGVTPTSAGLVLVTRARRLLAEVDEALDAVQRQIRGQGGRVRVGASTGALAHLLPQALQALARSHPELDVQVSVCTSADTLARLSAGSLDLGLVALPQAAVRGLLIQPWRRDPVMAFVPADWQPPSRLTPAWLAARPLILNEPDTRLSRQTQAWFVAAGQQPSARIRLNFNDAIKSLVAAGYGAALLPHEAGAPAPDARVVLCGLRPPLWRALGIACRAQEDEPSVRVVRDALAALQG